MSKSESPETASSGSGTEVTDTARTSLHELNAELKYEWDELMAKQAEALDAGDERAAAKHADRADRIKARIWDLNKNLVRFAVEPMRLARNRESWDDYDQYGAEGFLKAFPSWDPAKGTLATWTRREIFGTVQRGVRAVEKPEQSYGDHTITPHVRRAERELTRDGVLPTDGEIAEYLSATSRRPVTEKTVQVVRRPRPTSLDAPVGDDGGATLGDLVADSSGMAIDLVDLIDGGIASDPKEARFRAVIEQQLRHDLAPDELLILALTEGLMGQKLTNVKIDDFTGINRERVRRRRNDALAQIADALHHATLPLIGPPKPDPDELRYNIELLAIDRARAAAAETKARAEAEAAASEQWSTAPTVAVQGTLDLVFA